MDAPEHARIRRHVAAAFTPRMVERLRAGIRAHADALVREAAARDEFDAVRDLAAELPLLAIADLLGVPREERGRLFRWSSSLVGFDDPELGAGRIEEYKRTFSEAFAYALELAEARRRRPGHDLVRRLVGPAEPAPGVRHGPALLPRRPPRPPGGGRAAGGARSAAGRAGADRSAGPPGVELHERRQVDARQARPCLRSARSPW